MWSQGDLYSKIVFPSVLVLANKKVIVNETENTEENKVLFSELEMRKRIRKSMCCNILKSVSYKTEQLMN